MTFSAEAAAVQVKERLRALFDLVQDIEKDRCKRESVLSDITKIHDKITQEGKLTTYFLQKLKGLYKTAFSEAEQEELIIRKALNKIYEIRSIDHEHRLQARKAGCKETVRQGANLKMLQSTGQILPLWVGKPGEKPPPLCGAIPAEPSHIAKPGDMVAALVESEEGEEWIFAEVVMFNHLTKKYEIKDFYVETDKVQKERYTLSKRRVIPLPLMRANPETEPEALFPKGSVVMALYPQTTCFYKAVVNRIPSTPHEVYEVLFEDSSYPGGYAAPLDVCQRFVIAYEENKKSSKARM